MVEYPDDGFDNRQGYNLGYEISRLIRDYQVVTIILKEIYPSSQFFMTNIMDELGFETDEYDEALDYQDELEERNFSYYRKSRDSNLAGALREDCENAQRKIRKELRDLGVTYPSE